MDLFLSLFIVRTEISETSTRNTESPKMHRNVRTVKLRCVTRLGRSVPVSPAAAVSISLLCLVPYYDEWIELAEDGAVQPLRIRELVKAVFTAW
jgi:hypothetical protein